MHKSTYEDDYGKIGGALPDFSWYNKPEMGNKIPN
jgi:hypothetical protein